MKSNDLVTLKINLLNSHDQMAELTQHRKPKPIMHYYSGLHGGLDIKT